VGYADINLQIKFYEIRAEVIVVKDLSKDCLLGMELLETCPLTKEQIRQLRAVLEGNTAMCKPKQKKKIHRIQQQINENTTAKREWTRISETPTQDFFEGVEQQMDQKESEKPEIIRICSIDQLPTKVEAYSDKLKQETEIDILETEIKHHLKYIQVNSIELPCRKEKTIEEYKDEIANYIKDVCSDGLKGLKATSDITHIIELTDNKPFNERFRAVPHSKRSEFKKLLEDLLENDIIVESKSEYCSPPHVIMKADGSIRFTVDYKKLNSKTVKDNYPLPIIDDLLRELAQATYFSKMDLEQ
jgi:hypothetical protein